MNRWGYDEMSDSQVMIGALLQIMNELRINTDLRKELAKRFAEDRSHVPLSKRLEVHIVDRESGKNRPA